MSNQFVHMETHPMQVSEIRKENERSIAASGQSIDRLLSVEQVTAEAARLPGHHQHVVVPNAPIVHFGLHPAGIPADMQTRIDRVKAAFAAKKQALPRGQRRGKTRNYRKDTHVLISIVTSYPVPWQPNIEGSGTSLQDPAERAAYDKWLENSIAYAHVCAKAMGVEVLCIVEHTDEKYGHLHIYLVAENERMDARQAHPGHAAARAIPHIDGEEEADTKKRAGTAYKAAMAEFQDGWFENVSKHSHIQRFGPRRERRPRKVHLNIEATRSARISAEFANEQTTTAVMEEIGQFRQILLEHADNVIVSSQSLNDLHADVAAAKLEKAQLAADIKADQATRLNATNTFERQIGDLGTKLAALQSDVEAQQKEKSDLQQEIDQQRAKRDLLINEQAASAAAHEAWLRDQRQEIADLRAEADKKLAHANEKLAIADARIEGLDHYLNGGIVTRNGELTHSPRPSAEFLIRISPVRDWLREQIMRFESKVLEKKALTDAAHEALQNKLTRKIARADAMIAAVRGWAAGVLLGITVEVNEAKLPLFDMIDGPAADKLYDQISPFRAEVTGLLTDLPNRGDIAGLAHLASQLAPELDPESRQKAVALSALHARVFQQRKAEREQ